MTRSTPPTVARASLLLLAAAGASSSHSRPRCAGAAFVPAPSSQRWSSSSAAAAASSPFRQGFATGGGCGGGGAPSSVTSSSSSANGAAAAALSMSKNPDRARMEKNLEDLMDHDWRVFRAKLVLQEEREAEEEEEMASNNPEGGIGGERDNKTGDDYKLDRQENLGNLFAGVINSIFSGDDDDGDEDGNDVKTESSPKSENDSSSSSSSETSTAPTRSSSIFDGDSVGGATPSSVLDPFATSPKLTAVSPSRRVKPVDVDRHRWAHPIPHIEPGCVLVANERLGGVFHQTVVLVIDHLDHAGSTGIVINRPIPGNLQKVASEQPSNVNLSLKLAFADSSVTYGGPVLPEEYSILHGYGEVDGATTVATGVFVGGSEQLMNEVRRNRLNAKEALFVKGHVAWAPGQLRREVAKGVWYPASVSADFILRYAGAPVLEGIDDGDDLWSDILHCLGGKYEEACEKAHQQQQKKKKQQQ